MSTSPPTPNSPPPKPYVAPEVSALGGITDAMDTRADIGEEDSTS